MCASGVSYYISSSCLKNHKVKASNLIFQCFEIKITLWLYLSSLNGFVVYVACEYCISYSEQCLCFDVDADRDDTR